MLRAGLGRPYPPPKKQMRAAAGPGGPAPPYCRTSGTNLLAEFSTRHRLEHNQYVTQSQLLRMKELGVATNLFTNHIYYWGDLHYSTFIGPDRAEDMDPAGSAQRRFHCAPSPPRL